MTPIVMTAAAAVIAAGAGVGPVDQDRVSAAGIESAGANIVQVKHGYFRRDLGHDPAYQNHVHNDHGRKTKGFRSGGPRTYPEAGIIIYYDGGHHYIGHRGLRIKHGDPELLGK